MRAGASLVVFCILFWIYSIESARWSKWKDLTICDAKPCKCYNEEERCEKGKKIQVRVCIREVGDTELCKRNKYGPMRLKEKCYNRGVCPGWSEWNTETINCEENRRIRKRECNNPTPIHPDVLCVKYDGEGAHVEEETALDYNCTDEEKESEANQTSTTSTTTTTTAEPTTPLPYCEDSMDYGDIDDYLNSDLNNTDDSSFGRRDETTPKPSESDDYYYDLYKDLVTESPKCRSRESSTASDIYYDRGSEDSDANGQLL